MMRISSLSVARRLARFHATILAIVVSLCAWGILRTVERIQAEVEQFVFEESLANIQQKLSIETALNPKEGDCHFLDTPNFWGSRFGIAPALTKSSTDAREFPWVYSPKQHRLIYTVSTPYYFQSPIGPRIEVNLMCHPKGITLDISPHHWCLDRLFLGC